MNFSQKNRLYPIECLRTFGVFSLLCGVFFSANGDFLAKPDDNTLWIENGKNISSSAASGAADTWSGDLQFTPLAGDGGFSVASPSHKQHLSFRYVPISADYPWLVFEITGFEQKPSYTAWSFEIPNLRPFGQTASPRKGYYALNVFDGIPVAAGGAAYDTPLRLYVYGLKIDLKYLKMVKTPDYCVEVTSAAFYAKKSFASGDELKFTVRMKEPAEDVSLQFYHSYALSQLAAPPAATGIPSKTFKA